MTRLPGIRQLFRYPGAVWKRMALVDPSKAEASLGQVDEAWRQRIDDVTSCPDNAHISRVQAAGTCTDAFITMHNGVRVCARGYYGSGIMNMLLENRGVHEPQEERIFEMVLDYLPENPVMLELGAYWAFYSLSLLQRHPKAACHMVEPDPARMQSGKINFAANKRQGYFELGSIGRHDSWSWMNGPTITVDSYCRRHGLSHLHILHSDIQGFEFEMLEGAMGMIRRKAIDFVFVSTHTNELHRQCESFLRDNGFQIIASADMDDSFSIDGVIVAKRPEVAGPDVVEISKRSRMTKPGSARAA